MSPESRSRPLIGLTCRFNADDDSYYLPADYAQAIAAAGGIPVQIPLIPSVAAELVPRLDAVVLCGSASDIDPARFGEVRNPAVKMVHHDRDETDFRVLEQAFRETKPVLGICFGIQSLNVYLGGTLIQHIPEFVPAALEHSDRTAQHRVAIEPGSKLAGWAEGAPEIMVNSTHHQAVRKLGRGLQVAGRSPDGIVEAVEGCFSDHFVIGVQWHPERIWKQEKASRRIFAELVRAASAHRYHREGRRSRGALFARGKAAMKAAFLAVFLAGTLGFPRWAKGADSSQQARALLDQTVAALGGEAFLNLKSERIEGRIYAFRKENLSGLSTVVEYVQYPDKQRDEYGKKKEEIEIINGDKGWSIDIHGAKPIPPEEIKQQLERRSMSAFRILRYRLSEPDSTVEYAGRDFFDNREVDLVNFIDGENRTATIALDRITHLPARVVWMRRDPQTRERIEETEILSNYLRLQGVTKPRHLLRKRNDRKIFEAFIQEVEYNVALPDSLFAPPAR